ncbi:M48 family metallopeptidase [Geobacter sp. DSM 9736]|uniref:M48 family metallopeptidase n=1 Tax=Geobacter sp. DSM 9736 TaxID=1277350 RepID=UPI000B615B60|nr:M48 family metallopeptidase [Geobacter sp. DSM 9736]SNB47410.1 STE24 endopeptidase [Geobacter sp. DSM 9736]
MSSPQYILVAFYLTAFGLRAWLRFLNLRHLKKNGHVVPHAFVGAVDADKLRQTAAYTVEQSRLGLVTSLFDSTLLLIFIFGGLLPLYDSWISTLSHSFVGRGLLFFLFLSWAAAILEAPFSFYGTFRIESRYGFNTMTLKLWLSDLVKSMLLGAVLLGVLGGGALALVAASPERWWLWVWCFFAGASLFLMYISPYLIEPLFNKFEPIRDRELEGKVVELMERAGIKVSSVMQVDASRRSRHSNAYFTGIGKVKRIVLYDTLLEQMNHDEVLAVLAHEVGHWKKGHIRKRLLFTQVGAFSVCAAAHAILSWGGLPLVFGLPPLSFAPQLVLLSFLGTLLSFPLTPLMSWMSRRHEWESDRYAAELSGRPAALASALVKLSSENLANLHPHPLYAWFYYSHPPVVERVDRLQEMGGRSAD